MFYPSTPFIKYPGVESQVIKRNKFLLQAIYEWLCTPPKSTTYRVNTLNTNVNEIKAKIENDLRKKYPLFVPVVYSFPNIPEAICISSLPMNEAHKLLPKDGLNEIIVDTSCGASILRGAHLYAPGVLAMKSGTKCEEDVNVFADLEGRCKRGMNILYDSSQKVFLGLGTVKMARYQLFGENINVTGIAVEMKETISRVPSIGDLSSEKILLQNFPSIVCGRVLSPQSGETVLDMCTAPGNKLTHLVELMQDKGIVIALDKSPNKISSLKEKIRERGITSVKCYACDSTQILAKLSEHKDIFNGPPFQPESFDRILLDAPCSALGNRPLFKIDLSPKTLRSFPKVQKRLFTTAVGLLKVNGVLVYSTCTIAEDENEELVRWAIDNFPEMELVKSDPIFGGPGLKESRLTENERNLVQRFGPDDNCQVDSVGFFIAKFRKRKLN